MGDDKQQRIRALGRLGWSLRRIDRQVRDQGIGVIDVEGDARTDDPRLGGRPF
jgi:hypothetical protein